MRDIFHYPYTIDEGKEWIEFAVNSNFDYAITVNNETVGGIGLNIGEDIERISAEVNLLKNNFYTDLFEN